MATAVAGTQKWCKVPYASNTDWCDLCSGVGNGRTRSQQLSGLGFVPTMATSHGKWMSRLVSITNLIIGFQDLGRLGSRIVTISTFAEVAL